MRPSKLPTQQDILNDITDQSIFDERIIVAGSRNYYDYDFFAKQMKEIIKDIKGNIVFYSGMASSGADKLIIDFCLNEGYLYYPYPAEWDKFGKKAGFLRNNFMADTATWLIAFHDGSSPGTAHMIKIAKEKELRLTIIDISKDLQKRKVKLFTIQVAQWRLCNSIGVKFLDITAKSGIEAFSPDMENVYSYKNKHITEEEYTRLYLDKMTQSRSDNKKFWNHLLKFDSIAFGCYCPPNTFCHRHLFIKLAKDFFEENDFEVKLCGEITKESVDKEITEVVKSSVK